MASYYLYNLIDILMFLDIIIRTYFKIIRKINKRIEKDIVSIAVLHEAYHFCLIIIISTGSVY